MLFPGADELEQTANPCRVPDKSREELLRKITKQAQEFDLGQIVPYRHASIAYLGLCMLKHANETGLNAAMFERCAKIFNELKPDSAGKTVNCAWFMRESKARDHEGINSYATEMYLPGIKSKKKRGLVLLALGSEYDKSVPIPPDDTWIKNYRFN